MRDLVVSYLTTALLQVAGLASSVLSARLLLPDGRGELFAVLLWPQVIAGLAGLSLGNAANWRAARRTAGSAEAFVKLMAAGLPGAALGIAIGWLLIPIFMAQYDPALVRLAQLLLLVMVPAELLFGTMIGQLLSFGRVFAWNLLRLVQPLVYLGLMLTFWGLGTVSVPHVAVSHVTGGVVAGLIALVLIAPHLRRGQGRLDRGEFKQLLLYGLTVHVGVLLTMGIGQLDRMVLSALLPAAEVGYYAVALALVGGLGQLAQVPVALVMPKTAVQASTASQAVVLARYVKFTLVVASVAALGLALLAEPLVTLLFGADYLPGAAALRLLAPGAALLAVQNVLASGLQGAGRPGDANLARIAGLVVLAAGLALLVAPLGIRGAALAVLLGAAAQVTVGLWRATLRLEIGLARLLLPDGDDLAYLRGQLARLRRRVS